MNFTEALARLKLAQQDFNLAEPEYIEAAIYELKAAEESFRIAIREAKNKI